MFYAHRSDRYKFIMCTNGRCGSTLIKKWYLQIHGRPLPVAGDLMSIHGALLYDAPDLHVAKAGFNENPYFKFLVARNPWERLVSFYKVWVVLNQQNHESLGRGATFSQLINQIEKTGGSDAHVVSQVSGLEGLSFDRIVHLENVADGMRGVCSACNVKFDPKHFSEMVFQAPVNEGKGIESIPTTPGSKFVELDQWPEWRRFYTQKMADTVSRVYAKDIKAFGYEWKSVRDRVTFRLQQPELRPAPKPDPKPVERAPIPKSVKSGSSKSKRSGRSD